MSGLRAYDPAEFLEGAMRAFWAHGYAATSMADLVAATGVNRGSIYAAYDGKRDLFLAALRHYDRTRRAGFLEHLAAGPSPRAAILAAFAAAADDGGSDPPGCLLVNTATELGPHDSEIAALVADSLHAVNAFFTDRLRAGQTTGEVAPQLPVDTTATALLGLFLGLRVLSRTGADRTTRDTITSRARALLEARGLGGRDDVSEPSVRDEMTARLPREKAIPQVFIDGEHIGGREVLEIHLGREAGR